jgi:hypothetical protein
MNTPTSVCPEQCIGPGTDLDNGQIAGGRVARPTWPGGGVRGGLSGLPRRTR